jgi:hypothetical protein
MKNTYRITIKTKNTESKLSTKANSIEQVFERLKNAELISEGAEIHIALVPLPKLKCCS